MNLGKIMEGPDTLSIPDRHADHPLNCIHITPLICVQINPWTVCGSPLYLIYVQMTPWSACRSPPDLHADQPRICVPIDPSSDLCADHPLICVQITHWSACRSTPDLRAHWPFIWSMCRSTPDLRADQGWACTSTIGKSATRREGRPPCSAGTPRSQIPPHK